MAIIKTVGESEFINDMRDGFSYDGAMALYEYLDDLSDEMGEPIEMDVVAFRSSYTEYTDLAEALAQYDYDGIETDEDALEWLNDRTTVIEFDGGIILEDF